MPSNGGVRRSQPKARSSQARHTTGDQQAAWQEESQQPPAHHYAASPAVASPRPSHAPIPSHGASKWLDADCDRAWACLQSSLISDALQRIQQNRELEQANAEKMHEQQQQQRSPSHGKKRMTLREQLNEEWRQASEDALIARAARSDYFVGTTAANVATQAEKQSASSFGRMQFHREAPPSQLQRWSHLIASRYAASGWPAPSNLPPSQVFSQRDSDAPLLGPEHLFAATALEMLQAPTSKSGLDTVEIQQALQLQLQQMSQRVQIGLMQFPIMITPTRHDHERRRSDSQLPPSSSTSTSRLFPKLRRRYCASVIQRAWRRYRARSAGRQQRRAILHTRERERAEIEQEQRLHSIRIVQAALRTRIAQAQLKQSLARATALKAAARKIWTWWQWRAKIRQWHRRWQQTARASSLLYQKLSRQQIASIVLLQSAMRSYLARKHVVAWKVQMHRHRVRKQRAREWARKQMRSWKEVPLEESLVLSELYTHKEVAHTRREQQVERSLLSKKFSSWESSMQRYFLQKRPLPKHWLPQTDRHSGRTYYFNLKTGESRQDHPLHQAVEELRKKQQLQAERTLAERVATLREYEQRLQAGLTAQRAAKLEQLAQAKRLQ